VFRSESKLVLLSFNVQRGSYFAPDLKPEDVMLVEDGRPRAFTIFEGPNTGSRPPLELALLFDTTTLPPPKSGVKVGLPNGPGRTHWDRDATYGFAAQWTDADSRQLLERTGSDVRVSVYRYDHQQLQRLCRSTREPRTLTNAIHRLPELIPANEAIRLKLPPGRRTGRFTAPLITPADDLRPKAAVAWPMSWTLEAVIHTLRDSAVEQETAVRVLVAFSETTGPTSTRPDDAADVALSLNVPVYPVVLNLEQYIRSPLTLESTRNNRAYNVPYTLPPERLSRSSEPGGQLAAESLEGARRTLGNVSVELMLRFGELGPLTGGEAIFPSEMNRAALNDILGVIRDKSLSQYVVGFVPASSARPRKHDLKISIQTGGKLVGGQRTAVY
jgi:hypothetical protein